MTVRKWCPWCATPIRADRPACTLHEQLELEFLATYGRPAVDDAAAELEQLEAELQRDADES